MSTDKDHREPQEGTRTAPPIHLDRLNVRQRQGRSCVWCCGTPDPGLPPVNVPGSPGALYACACCWRRFFTEADK